MGFLDKLKSVKNTLTGGGAEVYPVICSTAGHEEFSVMSFMKSP